MPKLELREFRKSLIRNPDAASALGVMSYRRYLDGDFPAAIRWLMKYPDVGVALMKDAKELTPEVFEELDREAEKRSRKAVEARKRREAVRSRRKAS
jgi:hypothetical protein